MKNWHAKKIEEVFKELGSGLDGLSFDEAKKRLKNQGENKLPKKKPLSNLRVFLEQLKSPLVYILLLAGIVTAILGEYADTIVILAAVLLNTIVGYLQEKKANQALDKLKNVLQVNAFVYREGQEDKVLQKNLVVGDVILLRAGNKVPADARIIESHNLKISEASLTGEWVPATKSVERIEKDTPMANRDNMSYMGTVVESGWGKAVVTATGLQSEIGKVAGMIRDKKERQTPYQKKLARFSRIVGMVIVVISAVIFIEGILNGEAWVEMFTTAVAVAVAAIPSGLPVAMTVILALGMQRILKRKGLVRRLASAETLGSTSIILTDKTGTLTKAKMRLADIFAGKKNLCSEEKEDGKGFNFAQKLALEIGMFSSEAFVENPKEKEEDWIIQGAPTEKAIVLGGLDAGLQKAILEEEKPRMDRLIFDSNHQYSASLHQVDDKKAVLYMLGSPEALLGKATFLLDDQKQEDLRLSDLKKIKEKTEKLTSQGLRVVASAYKEISIEETKNYQNLRDLVSDLVFVGLFALEDPIREKTKEVIGLCRKAGMRPIIVTGDHKLTARSVGKELGFRSQPENILEGKDLEKLSEKEFQRIFKKIDIYARVEPSQKSRIIEKWQKRGEVVAMTGDGINDAPALKQADIGVAVGSGTDVAKEVSDLVLLTDNFNVIVWAVQEGRVIVDNIRKVVTYLLSDSFTEVILIGVSLLFGWPLPILAAQILWVNLIEDGPLGVCLAFEKKEKDIMEQKPRHYSSRLLTGEMKALVFIIGLITDVFLFILFFYLLKFTNYSIEHIRSIIFAGLTIDSILYIFSCKSLRRNIWHINLFSNKFLIWAWLFGVVALLGAIYLPPLQALLGTVPLTGFDWILILGLGAINIGLIEFTKWWFITHKYDD